MATPLSQILSDNNIEIRQKVLKDTVSQVIVADRLDAVAKFAASIVGSDSIGVATLTNSPTDLLGYDPLKYQRVDVFVDGEYSNWKDDTNTSITVSPEDLSNGKIMFVGTGGVWKMEIIPMIIGDYTPLTSFNPVKDKVEGKDFAMGVTDDLSTYVGANPSAFIRLNKAGAALYPGQIQTVDLVATQAGIVRIVVFRLTTGTSYRAVRFAEVDCAIGVNTFVAGIDFELQVDAGDLIGISQLEAGGRIANKSKVGGCFTNGAVDIIEGGVYEFLMMSDAEFAIRATARYIGLEESVSDLSADITTAVTVSDLALEFSGNLAREEFRRENTYINSSGGKTFAEGWRSYRIPVSAGQSISFGRFQIATGGYSAFFDATDNPATAGLAGSVLFNGNYTTGSLPKTVVAPAGAAWLYIVTKRPTNSDADSQQLTINNSPTLLAYEDPSPRINAIRGYALKGGGSSVAKFSDLTDVPGYAGNNGKGLRINAAEDGLETFEPVVQNTDAVFTSITAGGMALDLPAGAGVEPAGLAIGDAWVDTTNSVIKIKLS